ncbi:MAG: MerR family DNA-binding protein [Polyangiaceae bacterium]
MARLTMLEVARAADVPRTTIRFYERAALLPTPSRSRAGYRLFPEETVVIVRFVKRAQGLGFTLEELRAFLALSRGKVPRGVDVVGLARAKVAEIDDKVKSLRRVRRAIEERIARGHVDGPCPILASLGGEVPSLCGAPEGELEPPKRRESRAKSVTART